MEWCSLSRQLISRSADLKRLQDEGYDVQLRGAYLLIGDVPYVSAEREVKRGKLVVALNLAGDQTDAPNTHVAMFIGEFPCDSTGAALEKIRSGGAVDLIPGELAVDYSFSSKPLSGGYSDYHEQVTSYVAILENEAHGIDPTVTARTFSMIVPDEDDDSVFHYLDTATSRANTGAANAKLEEHKVAIVGLGGTGSYVLDLLAKTPVREIHLFDGDTFLSHNAFRAPGAPSIDQLRAKQTKVAYLAEQYGKMRRRGLVAHEYYVDESTVDELAHMDFVFLCVDAGGAKKLIVEKLESFGLPFTDTGMGVEVVSDALTGILRVTSSLPDHREAVRTEAPLADANLDNDYNHNVQIAELNALNAAMAVIKWKKLCGFYHDYEHELHSTYTIDCNMMLSEYRL